MQGNRRSAAIVALEESVLECFSRSRFIEEVTKNPDEALELIKTLSFRARSFFDLIDELIDSRRSSAWREQFGKIFQSVFGILRRRLVAVRSKQDDRRVLDITDLGERRRVKAGTTLFHEGSPSNWAALILSGSLEARKKVELEWVILGSIDEGQLVGELGLLQKRERSATVVVVEDAELEFLNEEKLFELLRRSVEERQRVIEDLSNRSIRLVALLSEIAVHEDLTDSVVPGRIHSVLDSVEDVVYLAREVVVHDLRRLQSGLQSEAKSVGAMFATYGRYIRKEASEEDMEEANKAFRNVVKTLGMGTLFLLPGGLITIPLVVKLGQRFGIEFMPEFSPDTDVF
ncbi:MAG: cyclic nucleotide-binding domain-containing protein [Planctomycetota bacterium]|nr:cyclic nucleotide-binding domain-containing protein [Planctomycetota bacterium]